MFSLRSRLFVLAWLTIWIIAVPLFHTHVPDNTDGWSALHSGGAHTVFTPDLPGEYSPPFHDNQPGRSSQLSGRAINSPELGIPISDDPDDHKIKAVPVLTVLFGFSNPSLGSDRVFVRSETYRPLQPFQGFSASRAPPLV